MHSRIDEIQSFLSHKDYSLAVRRTLDTCLDSGNASLLRDAISWSRMYHSHQKDALPDVFFSQATVLLDKLKSAGADYTYSRQPLLSAEHISKTYTRGNFSLHPISLQIETGDITGVVGQNGNGKTTLLRCLAGQLAIDDGRLQYNQLNNPDYYSIKHHVAFIPQRIPRWYGLLKDNLHFSASLSGIKGEQNKMMVDFMLERLNLSNYAHLTWKQISSGYRTRFEIARILLQKPRLLILDEPLANLDINAQQTILTDLRYIAKSVHNPMGIILSSQQLHEVEKVADTVLLIKEGNCLFRTGEQSSTSVNYVLEVETNAERNTILSVLGNEQIELHYNGGFYTISSPVLTAQDMIARLVNGQITITYFRDITHSTKRFF